MDDTALLHSLRAEGRCCAQVMVAMGLRLHNAEDPFLENAAFGLCRGVQSGLTCGALTGAAMVLSMTDRELAASEMIPALTKWFAEKYTPENGDALCRDILAGDPGLRGPRCINLIEDVWRKTKEILEDEGFETEISEDGL